MYVQYVIIFTIYVTRYSLLVTRECSSCRLDYCACSKLFPRVYVVFSIAANLLRHCAKVYKHLMRNFYVVFFAEFHIPNDIFIWTTYVQFDHYNAQVLLDPVVSHYISA
jgi:hypothetical protein